MQSTPLKRFLLVKIHLCTYCTAYSRSESYSIRVINPPIASRLPATTRVAMKWRNTSIYFRTTHCCTYRGLAWSTNLESSRHQHNFLIACRETDSWVSIRRVFKWLGISELVSAFSVLQFPSVVVGCRVQIDFWPETPIARLIDPLRWSCSIEAVRSYQYV